MNIKLVMRARRGGGLEWALDPPRQKKIKNRFAIRRGIYATFSHFLQVEAFLLCFCYRGALSTVGGLCDFFLLYNYRGLYAMFFSLCRAFFTMCRHFCYIFLHVGALIFVFMGGGGIFWIRLDWIRF